MIKTNYKLTHLFSVSLAWQICGCGTCGRPSFVSDKQEWRPALLTTSKSWVPFSKFTKQIMIKSQWTVLRPKDKVYTLLEAKSAHKQAYQPHISLSLKSSLNSTNWKTTYIHWHDRLTSTIRISWYRHNQLFKELVFSNQILSCR